MNTPRRGSRVLRRTPLAWDVELDDTAHDDETRPMDFLAFVALAFPATLVPVLNLPVNEVAALMLCAIAYGRLPERDRRLPGWLFVLLGLLLVVMVTVSVRHAAPDLKRLGHFGLYAILVVALASGRIHLPSAARGLALGLLGSISLTLAGFGGSGYTGRLSGTIGDPNSGGFTMAVLGAIAVGLLPRGRLRSALMVILLVGVALTYSRTSLLAVAFVLVWVLVGRRAGPVLGIAAGAAGVYVVGHIPTQLRLFGPFADRTGSDDLRMRIIAQEKVDIAQSPLFGAGAGSAHVDLAGQTFFYHSSYLALQREGGLIAVAVFLLLVAATALANLRLPRIERDLWLEAALIALMVCAVNLGEVLMELPGAVALGIAAHQVVNVRARQRREAMAQASASRSAARRPPGRR